MLAAVHTVEAYDPNIVSESDWDRIKGYLLTLITRDIERCKPDSEDDERREMRDVEKKVMVTILDRFRTCGMRSGPDAVYQISVSHFGMRKY